MPAGRMFFQSPNTVESVSQVLPVVTFLGVLFVTFSRVVGDLHLGDQKVTWKKLEYIANHYIYIYIWPNGITGWWFFTTHLKNMLV